jgi:hypothetical protein
VTGSDNASSATGAAPHPVFARVLVLCSVIDQAIALGASR